MLLNLLTALSPKEELWLRLYGTLSRIPSLCQISLFVPKGLKLVNSNSYLTDYDGEELLLESELKKLPNFEKQINEMGHLVVDMVVPVLSVKDNSVQVLLPKSYKMIDNIKTSPEERMRTFTFKTEHTYLIELISMILENKPVVRFYGPLSKSRPERSRVTISFPVRLDTDTLAGGRVSLSTQGITLAVVDNIPEWENMSENLGTPGELFTNFEAVILKAHDNEITVALPSSYR